MKRAILIMAALTLLLGGVGQAKADVIVGPTLNEGIAGYNDSGIEFTALNSTSLQSFVYQNQGLADTINLLASDESTILYSLAVPSGNPSFLASGLNWSLTAGNDYYLEVTTNSPHSNGMFAYYFYYPTSGMDLRVNYSFFDPYYPSTTAYWADFNNITTAVSTVPEPSGLALFGLGIVCLAAGYVVRRKTLALTVA